MNHEFKQDGRVVYLQDWPDEILPSVQKAMAECAWLIPPWCHEVIVTYAGTISDRVADISTDFKYRLARLRICAQFIDQTEQERINVLYHELLHISTSPIVDFCADTFKSLLKDDEHKAHCKMLIEALNERHEGCVEDLSYCIEQRQTTGNVTSQK